MERPVHSDSVNRLLLRTGLGAFELREDLRMARGPADVSRQAGTGRAISAEFRTDLEIAARRSMRAYEGLLDSGRDTGALMTALDGRTTEQRDTSEQVALLRLIEGLADPQTGLRFLPAVSADAPDGGPLPQMEYPCACGVDAEGARAYLSSDLGFRDLFPCGELAIATALALRARAAGVSVDMADAVPAIAGLLAGEETAGPAWADGPDGWLSTGTLREPLHVVARHDGTGRG